MERQCSALGWDQVFESPTQISSELRQARCLSNFVVTLEWLLVHNFCVSSRQSHSCPAKLTAFQDLETSRDEFTWPSGWWEGGA